MNDMDQRCVAVFDQEGVLFLKIDRMLYGFYYLTSCQSRSALMGLTTS